MRPLITDQLLKALNDLEESPWATVKPDGKALDARALAQRVGQYGIKSRNIRDGGGKVLKGYMREDFLDAWSRYLPDDPVGPPPIGSATSATSLHSGGRAIVSRLRAGTCAHRYRPVRLLQRQGRPVNRSERRRNNHRYRVCFARSPRPTAAPTASARQQSCTTEAITGTSTCTTTKHARPTGDYEQRAGDMTGNQNRKGTQ